MDHRQQQYPQQAGAPYSGGYGYGGGVAPQHYPPHMAAAAGGFGGRAMAAPMTNYNTQGNAGATTIPNFGGSGSPGVSAEMGDTTAFVAHPHGGVAVPPPGAANFHGGPPTALPPPQGGGFQVGGVPNQAHILPNGGHNSGRSSRSGNGSKGSRSSKRDAGDEDPSVFDLFASVLTGISRQTSACVSNSCGGADSDDEDEEKTMANPSMLSRSVDGGTAVNDGRILVQNQVDAFGNVYSGQTLGGQRDGLGTIYYAKSGGRYEGMWQGHQPHGDGKVIRGDGTGMFEGRWHNGTLQMVKNGHACVQDAGGNRYEGNFSNWKKHGKGRVQTVTGEQYEGEWVNGIRQGFGTLIRPDGSRFEGMFNKNEPTKNGKNFKRGAGLNKSRSRPMSPVRHGRNGMMSRDADDEEEDGSPTIPNNSFLTSDNEVAIGSNEFDNMVATDNFAPTKFKSKDEKKAVTKLVKQKQRLEKAHVEQEHRKKKQVESLLKAEVKQKRQFSAKMKREQKRLDERQKIQAKALNQAKEEQEKYLTDLERQHQHLVKEKMKEIERLQIDAVKKNEADKRRLQKEIEAERIRLQKFEVSQKAALEKQAKELEVAQRKFASEQARAMTEQQKREHVLKVDADQQRAAMARQAERDAFVKQRKEQKQSTRELKQNLKGYSKQVAKNQEMSMKVEGLKKKSKLFSFKNSMNKSGQDDEGFRGRGSDRRSASRRRPGVSVERSSSRYHSGGEYAPAGGDGYYAGVDAGGYGDPQGYDFRDDVDQYGAGGFAEEAPPHYAGVRSEDMSFDI